MDDSVNQEATNGELMSSMGSSVGKADPAWKYGSSDPKDKNSVRCKFCGEVKKGGITRFKKHLAGIKGDCAPCKSTPEDVRKEIKSYLEKAKEKKDEKERTKQELRANVNIFGDIEVGDVNHVIELESDGQSTRKKRKVARGPMDNFVMSTVDTSLKEKGKQTTIENRFRSKEAREAACQYIARWYYKNGIPFNTAGTDSFKEMVQAIGCYGAGMDPPTPYELSETLLKKELAIVNEKTSSIKNAWETYGVTIMTDGWTDRRRRSIMNILVNCPLGTMFLRSHDCSGERHTAEFICKLVQDAIEEVGASNVVQVVTDNAAANLAAGELLEKKIPHIMWSPCAAHCLDLMLENIGKLDRIKMAVQKAKRIGVFIYSHHNVLHMMREATNNKELVRPGITRFATAFLCLKSLYDKKDELQKMFKSQLWTCSQWAKDRVGKRVQSIIRSSSFWNAVTYTLKIMNPLVTVLRMVETEVAPPMPFLYNAMEVAKMEIAQNFNDKESEYSEVWKIIDKRWEKQLHSPLHAAAYYLNPRFFYSDKMVARNGSLKSSLTTCVEKMVPEKEVQDKIMKELPFYRDAQYSFGKELAKRQRNILAPGEWWDAYGISAPNLQRFAMRILNLTCSASGCERNWSVFEGLHTVKRNRLEQKKLNDLVFVRYNWKLMDRYKKMKAGDIEDAIILENDDAGTKADWLRDIPNEEDIDVEVEEEEPETRMSARISSSRGQGSQGVVSAASTSRQRERFEEESLNEEDVEEEEDFMETQPDDEATHREDAQMASDWDD